MNFRSSGFTLIEMMIVIGLLAVLFSLGGVVYTSFSRQDQLTSEAEKIVSALNEARAKTLAGYSGGGTDGLNFGVYFDSTGYVLFQGTTYIADSPTNQRVNLAPKISLSEIAFPDQQIVFRRLTGEVIGFSSGQDFLILADQQSSRLRRLKINQLGLAVVE